MSEAVARKNIMDEMIISNEDIDKLNKFKVLNGGKKEKEEIEMEDFFKTSLEDLESFDNNAWNKGDGFKMPNFPIITEKLEGLDSGLYLFAGKSNHGKSAIMMNLMQDACSNSENKLFGIYYSLDDSKNEIIPRLIAMDQSIPIGVAAKPQRWRNLIDEAMKTVEYSETGEVINIADDMKEHDNNMEPNIDIEKYEEYLNRREIGLQSLRDSVNHFKIEDSTKIKNADDMYEHIKMVLTYLRAEDPEYRLLIAIDSINDLRLTYKPNDNDVLAAVAKTVKEWTVEFDCPIFASTHIRKLNGTRRPTLEDLKDSTVLVYEASVVWIVYNDVSENKQGANIYQIDSNGEGIKIPVLEIDWAKNKKSSYKGHSFCYFRPEFSKALEADKDTGERFTQLIYSK